MNPDTNKLFTADQLLAAWRNHRNETNRQMTLFASDASIRFVDGKGDRLEAERAVTKMKTVAETLTSVEGFLAEFLSPNEP